MNIIFHLHKDVYEIVKGKTKNVEARVNDEKRKKISIGDTITFINRGNEEERINAVITNLNHYKDFEELANHYEMARLYLKEYTKEMWLNELARFYNKEEIAKDGVVAIEFKIID